MRIVKIEQPSETFTSFEMFSQIKDMSFYQFEAQSLSGQNISLNDYQGKVVLVVNTASKCGFTPQYTGLQELHKELKDSGLEILGFPCNQFGGQEPGSEEEIASECLINYGVTFQMFSKVDVNGANAHPIFEYLKDQKGGLLGKKIKWNFTKFLIDRDGNVVDRFASTTAPSKIKKHIEKLI